jgi:hypothetical protein
MPSGGSNVGNFGGLHSEAREWMGSRILNSYSSAVAGDLGVAFLSVFTPECGRHLRGLRSDGFEWRRLFRALVLLFAFLFSARPDMKAA